MYNCNVSDSTDQTLFILLRHGETDANVAGIITSELGGREQAVNLTDNGRFQVRNATEQIRKILNRHPKRKTVVVASPFNRTIQTAMEFIHALEIPVIYRTDV